MGRITLWGFYNRFPDLFDDIVLPDTIIKDNLINLIMQRSGMLFPIHQQPDFLKGNIRGWFERKRDSFARIEMALTSEYNPIENYDRKENWTDTPNVSYVRTGGHTSDVTNKPNVSNEDTVAAFNSDSYAPSRKNVTSGTTTGKENFVYNDETQHESGTRTHEGRVHGNIGVTTNQQMIQSEITLRMFDLYETIATMFENEFLSQVY